MHLGCGRQISFQINQNSKNSRLVFFIKHVNCCKKEQGMRDDEHSDSEFYCSEEGNLNVSLQNEKFEASEVFEGSEVFNNNDYTDGSYRQFRECPKE